LTRLGEKPTGEGERMYSGKQRQFIPRHDRAHLYFPFGFSLVDQGAWSRLSFAAAKVYPVIAVHANISTGEGARPSMETIAICAGLSKRAVIKAVDELVRSGLIEITEKATTHTTNRYRVIGWRGEKSAPRGDFSSPRGDDASPSRGREITSRGEPDVRLEVKEGHPKESPVIINQVINNTESRSKRRSGGGAEELDRSGSMAEALSLRGPLGKSELDRFLEDFGPEIGEEAVIEAVAQGKPTLKYARGIARKWKAAGGRIVHSTRAEAAREVVFERRSQDDLERLRKEERTRRQFEARILAEQKLGECAPSLLSLWQAEIELEADREKIHSLFRESWMRSKLLVRVAREFGIEGL
jgi:DnaD/phage-associated family protein